MGNSTTITVRHRCTCPNCRRHFIERIQISLTAADRDGDILGSNPTFNSNFHDRDDVLSTPYMQGREAVRRMRVEREHQLPVNVLRREVAAILDQIVGLRLRFMNEPLEFNHDTIMHPTDFHCAILRIEAWSHHAWLGFLLPEDEVRKVAGELEVRKRKSGTGWVFVKLPNAEAAQQLAPLVRKAVRGF